MFDRSRFVEEILRRIFISPFARFGRDIGKNNMGRLRERLSGRKIAFAIVAALLSIHLTAFELHPAHAVDQAVAQGPALNIALLVSSRADECFDRGDIGAIKAMTGIEEERINAKGGVAGHLVKVQFLDDKRDQEKLNANISAALDDPNTLAIVGLTSNNRGTPAFKALGKRIGDSGIPFIADFSSDKEFAPYKNVFTTSASLEGDNVPVLTSFIQKIGYKRPAFVGGRDSFGVMKLGDGFKDRFVGDYRLVADVRIAMENERVSAKDAASAVTDIKTGDADIVFLYVASTNAGATAANITTMLTELANSGVTPALFLGGVDTVPEEVLNAYPNAIYSLSWDNAPEVYASRWRRMITPKNAGDWVFVGGKVAAAPGWAKGECAPRPDYDVSDPFNEKNMRAVSRGGQFADMVALVADAAKTREKGTGIAKLRAKVVSALGETYQAGRDAFKGPYRNWSFLPATRTAARDPFIIIRPQNLERTQLAPIQFLRTKDGGLRQIDTIYADIDLIKIHRVEENEGTFFAEFYLALRANEGADISRIEFANAYLEAGSAEAGGGRQVSVQEVHRGGRSDVFPETMKIYKISGKFLFDPELASYPFDTQRFAIDLQPKNGALPFLVQPPRADLRNTAAVTDGWDSKAQYVAFDQELLPVIDAYTHAPRIVPFYKTSFAWQMQRQTTDYLLRVAVPLAFIMFVAYLSIFIPRSHFEAIVTIQVTALLSAVALYLSLPKLESNTATISDRAFVFAYMIVSIMIGISILRVSPLFAERRGAKRVIELMHIVAIPALVAIAAFYVYGLRAAAA